MPIIVTKEIARTLAERMECELDWNNIYTLEERLNMFTVFIQAAGICGYDPKYAIERFQDRSKDLVEDKEPNND